MSELDHLALVPGVTSAVLGDLQGTHRASMREPDGESVSAIAGVVALGLIEAGEPLGLGLFDSASIAGPARAQLLIMKASDVLAATIEPAGVLPNVEKALQGY